MVVVDRIRSVTGYNKDVDMKEKFEAGRGANWRDNLDAEDKACCACLNVKYDAEDCGGGIMRERWVCALCGREFQPRPLIGGVPLPVEWRGLIPPSAIVTECGTDDHYKTTFSRPVWNKVWLKGLERFVRGIVRDEM